MYVSYFNCSGSSECFVLSYALYPRLRYVSHLYEVPFFNVGGDTCPTLPCLSDSRIPCSLCLTTEGLEACQLGSEPARRMLTLPRYAPLGQSVLADKENIIETSHIMQQLNTKNIL